MKLILFRTYSPAATLGRLRPDDGGWELQTIERPWIENPDGPGGMIRHSCVPEGRYIVRPHDSSRFPGTYVLENADLCVYCYTRPDNQTWGRTAILIHAGNTVRDVVGCIAVGMLDGALGNQPAVLHSRVAMRLLREKLGREETHELEIRADFDEDRET